MLINKWEKKISYKHAILISKKLNLDSAEKEILIQDALLNLKGSLQFLKKETILKNDEFKLIADWYHFAILSLAETSNSYSDHNWIARRLNIPPLIAKDALDRLVRLNLILINGEKLFPTGNAYCTTTGIPSGSIKKNHKQILNLAISKIDITPLDLREYSSIIFAVQTSKIPEAKKLIKDFKMKLANLLESTEKSDEIYACAIQLFPLSSHFNKR